MTSFEFFTVLLSFVVSLGVANLLQTVARLIQESSRVQFSLAYALWAAAIFNLQITFWLRSWSYNEGFALRTETSLPPLALAIIAFVACGLATPRIADEGTIDLREFHQTQGRKYQIAFAAFMFVAIVQGVLMADLARDSSALLRDSIVQGVLAFIAIAAAIFRRQTWLQVAAPALFLLSAVQFYGRLME